MRQQWITAFGIFVFFYQQPSFAKLPCASFASTYVCSEPYEAPTDLVVEVTDLGLALDGQFFPWTKNVSISDSQDLIEQTAMARCQGEKLVIQRRAKDVNARHEITGEIDWVEKFELSTEGITIRVHGHLKSIGQPEQHFDGETICRRKSLHILRGWMGLP